MLQERSRPLFNEQTADHFPDHFYWKNCLTFVLFALQLEKGVLENAISFYANIGNNAKMSLMKIDKDIRVNISHYTRWENMADHICIP